MWPERHPLKREARGAQSTSRRSVTYGRPPRRLASSAVALTPTENPGSPDFCRMIAERRDDLRWNSMSSRVRSRVAVILTGGTIDSLGVNRLDLAWYFEANRRLDKGELLARIPEFEDVASV